MEDVTAPYAAEELRAAIPLRVHLATRVAAKTDLGRVRENNEDKHEHFVPEVDSTLAARGHVYVVCDGMGGHNAGQIASELAVKTFIDVYLNHPGTDPGIAATAGILAANRFVRDVGLSVPSRRGMGTTLSALLLVQDQAWIAHVGDSRIYRLREGALEQLTRDHTWVEDAVRSGVMSRQEAEAHAYRHVITQAVGTEADVTPDLFSTDLQPGDRFLLCSDGLNNHVQDDAIRTHLTQYGLSEACWRLVNLALAEGGSDNCTVMIVSVDAITQLEP